ncbi:MAG: hypothetical protein JST13_08455, partial [Bacteroidetes bacterium]|nr:hypothetical protein [Bacteroidota bacterium]
HTIPLSFALPKKIGRYFTLLLCFLPFCKLFSQTYRTINTNYPDSNFFHFRNQKDLIDVGLRMVGRGPGARVDSNSGKPTGRLHISGAPSPSYSLATSFALNVTGNIAFYAGGYNNTNISSILIAPLYTIKKQFALPVQFSIWIENNQFNIVGDWRFLTYPEDTYGLGGLTTDGNAVPLNYNYVRLYTFLNKTIIKNFYAGIGYEFDNHWNIQQVGIASTVKTDFDKYGFSSSSVSSGPAADVLFDSRKNSINPIAGEAYANIVFRQNLKAIGSDGNWESLLIDIRKYLRLNGHTHNVLAIWSYNWLTLNGKPPYMDLPSTSWDTYGNTGRGYIQSRFRSGNMIDLEAEYRFGILSNGLIGGVVFGNLQSYSEYPSNKFEAIEPGYGAGIRIKFNKFSKTNICLDYAFGLHGSNGLFVNLGEVF